MDGNQEQVQQVTITQQDAVKRYGVSDRTLRQWAQDGKISIKRFGKRTFLLVRQLDELLVPVKE